MTGKGKAGSGGKVLVSDGDIPSPCIPLIATIHVHVLQCNPVT